MSCPTRPPISAADVRWTPKHFRIRLCRPLVYHAGAAPMPAFSNRQQASLMVLALSALDHQQKGFRRYARVRVQHAKPVTTRLPQLDIGGESARLVGLGR